jgi:sulfonate transport system permease protein
MVSDALRVPELRMNVRSVAVDRVVDRFPAVRRIWTARAVGHRLLPLAIPLIVLIAWQCAASLRLLPVQILPPPLLVATTAIDLIRGGEIVDGLRVSLWRIGIGFAIGAGSGLVLGALLGLSRTVEAYCGLTFRLLAQIPSLGWLPILLLIFGLDETLKFVLIAKASFVPTVIATSESVKQIPAPFREVARVLHLPARSYLRRLVLPATIPGIFSGLRTALSHAWIALIVVEMLAATEGVGYTMVWGRTLFQIDIVIVGMAVIGLIGLAMDTGLARIEQRLQHWEPRS